MLLIFDRIFILNLIIKIKQGAVVLAYEDGRPADVVHMNNEEVEVNDLF